MPTNLKLSDQVLSIWKDVAELYISSSRPEAHWLWKNHVQVVARNASKLSDQYGGKKDLAVIGALLHDVADVKLERDDPSFEAETHCIIDNVLKKNSYTLNDCEKIKNQVIEPHSCYPGNLPQTIEGKILATADALAHLETDFYREAYQEFFIGKKTVPEYNVWVRKKLKRDFEDKLFFVEVKEQAKPFYEKLMDEFRE